MRLRNARTAALFAGAALFCSAPVAVADSQLGGVPQVGETVTCQSNGNMAFSPGVIPTPFPRDTNVQAEAVSTSCAGTTLFGDQIVSSNFKAGFDSPLSCFYGGTSKQFSGTATIEWHSADGMTYQSTAQVHISGQLLNTVTVDGQVTDGLYAGENLHGQMHVSLAQGAVDCVGMAVAGGVRTISTDMSLMVSPQ